jgi:hypothetical protein
VSWQPAAQWSIESGWQERHARSVFTSEVRPRSDKFRHLLAVLRNVGIPILAARNAT